MKLKDIGIYPPTPKGTEELLGDMFDLQRKQDPLEEEVKEMQKMDAQDIKQEQT